GFARARQPHATANARSRRRLKAAHTRSHSPRTFVTPRKVRRRKPIARLTSACRRKTCRTRAGRIAQRGGGGAVGAPMRRRAGGGRWRHPARRRRIEAETAPPPPRTAVSGHAPRLGRRLAQVGGCGLVREDHPRPAPLLVLLA